jgi:hypothetical protein
MIFLLILLVLEILNNKHVFLLVGFNFVFCIEEEIWDGVELFL